MLLGPPYTHVTNSYPVTQLLELLEYLLHIYFYITVYRFSFKKIRRYNRRYKSDVAMVTTRLLPGLFHLDSTPPKM